MPILSRSRRYLFIMTPRTGCTAVATGVLIPHLDGGWFPTDHVTDARGRVVVERKHSDLAQLHHAGLLAPDDTRGLFKFCTVRNPFDSLVSLYFKQRTLRRRQMGDPGSFIHRRPHFSKGIEVAVERPFAEWLEFHLRPKSARQWLAALRHRSRFNRGNMYGRFVDGVDHVMRYEHLQPDFDEVQRRLGVDDPHPIPAVNTTEDRDPDYRAYYTARARDLVERVFSEDLRRFGYEF